MLPRMLFTLRIDLSPFALHCPVICMYPRFHFLFFSHTLYFSRISNFSSRAEIARPPSGRGGGVSACGRVPIVLSSVSTPDRNKLIAGQDWPSILAFGLNAVQQITVVYLSLSGCHHLHLYPLRLSLSSGTVVIFSLSIVCPCLEKPVSVFSIVWLPFFLSTTRPLPVHGGGWISCWG
jgi:hypothetical protein